MGREKITTSRDKVQIRRSLKGSFMHAINIDIQQESLVRGLDRRVTNPRRTKLQANLTEDVIITMVSEVNMVTHLV